MNILILTGGTLPACAGQTIQAFCPDFILAADAGVLHAKRLNIVPDLAVGDFDSGKEEALAFVQKHGIERQLFPPEKDYTDTELALHIALEKTSVGDEILLLGALGTRFDHSLANVYLLKQAADAGVSCRIVDDHNEVRMIKGSCKLSLQKEDDHTYISLIPVFGPVIGVTLTGFQYPLTGAEFACGNSLGISNRQIAEEADIRIEGGYLLVIQARD